MPCFLYTVKISANSEPWLRTLPWFHSLLYFFGGFSKICVKRWYSESSQVFPALGEWWGLAHAQAIVGFLNHSAAISWHCIWGMRYTSTPQKRRYCHLGTFSNRKSRNKVSVPLELATEFPYGGFWCTESHLVAVCRLKSLLGPPFLCYVPYPKNAPAMVKGLVPGLGMDALRRDQRSGIPSRGGQEPSLSPRPRTTKITAFLSQAVLIIRMREFCCPGMQSEVWWLHCIARTKSKDCFW